MLLSSELGEPGQESPAFPNFGLAFWAAPPEIAPFVMDSSATTTDSLLKVLAWLDKNRKRVALITGGVVVALAIIAGIIYYQSQKEGWASEALSNVRKPYNPATAPSADLAQAYLKVARDYEGTKAAGRALLEAASFFYTQGSFNDAETQYKKFLNDYPDSPFLAQGMLGLASTLDAQGKSSEAIAKYEELRRRFPNDSVIDETKLALARLYEKQNPADAYKLYSELTATVAQTGIGSEAGIRLADLLEKYPDLAKTNAPPAPTATTAQPQPQVTVTRNPATNVIVMTTSNAPKTSPARPPLTSTAAPAPQATAPPTGRPLLVQPQASGQPTPPLVAQPKPATNQP